MTNQQHPFNIKPLTSYWERTQWPLQSLLFLLPLLILYELGTVFFAPGAHERLPPLVAESLLNAFFQVFGVTSYHLPAIVVVVVLLCWHLVRGDPWRLEPRLWLTMAGESILLAIPLFVFMLVLFRQPAMRGMTALSPDLEPLIDNWRSGVVIAIGAGIYEELVFRLIAIALLHAILVDLLMMPQSYGIPLTVIGSALLFSFQHFHSVDLLNWTPAEWGRFTFYTLAGLYLAGVYMLRGFGLAVGAHAVYDILWVTALFWQQ